MLYRNRLTAVNGRRSRVGARRALTGASVRAARCRTPRACKIVRWAASFAGTPAEGTAALGAAAFSLTEPWNSQKVSLTLDKLWRNEALLSLARASVINIICRAAMRTVRHSPQ